MKMFSDCSGECCLCGVGSGCLAGHGDDDFYPATKEQIIERLDKGRYPSYRQMMIDHLKRAFNYDYHGYIDTDNCVKIDPKEEMNKRFGNPYKNFLHGGIVNEFCCKNRFMEDNMKKYSITECRECKYKVTTKDGEYNPNDIVCCYLNSDGLEVYDYCSRSKKGIYKPDPNDSTETNVKAPMLRFMLDGCDISYAAEAPADMTLAQLLKQCDRIHPDYCACGIRSTDKEPELIFGYDGVDYVRGETRYAACSIDGVNEPTCEHCIYLQDAEEGRIGKCGNKNSSFYNCLRDVYKTCELQEDENNEY